MAWGLGLALSCLTMADVKLVASSHMSKTSHGVDPSRVSSMPLTEAPAFIQPPRNLCIKEGATAKFEGRPFTTMSVFNIFCFFNEMRPDRGPETDVPSLNLNLISQTYHLESSSPAPVRADIPAAWRLVLGHFFIASV
ncbi:hypothetical protein ACRRTK_018799 [Alexandromys fortis]